ncbi:MAG: hypothetical protein QE487_02170 [Fluviicola sp.]|nr:hypothetical protein [Fluviicola sp.]
MKTATTPLIQSGSKATTILRQLITRNWLIVLILLLGFLAPYSPTYSQCLPPPAPLNCPIAGSIPLVEGMVLTAGNTYTVTGVLNINNITMSGGTLVVCGTLNLANLTFNSGNLYVPQGGFFNYTNGVTALVMGTNSNIYNFGTTTFACSIVTGPNNIINNCLITSVFTTPFNQMIVQGPNTYFINNGTFVSSFFIVQSTNAANPVCSGPGSTITTNTMINQLANAFNSPDGPSCIQITQNIINSQPMTASGNVNIGYNAGSVNTIQGPAFGSATVSNPCFTCSVPLPTGIVSTTAECNNLNIQVDWLTDSEPTRAVYDIQYSEDGNYFADVAQVVCEQATMEPQSYSAEIPTVYSSVSGYIRLKRTSETNETSYSETLTIDCSTDPDILIYPTMVSGSEITVLAKEAIESIVMYSMDGKVVQIIDVQDKKEIVLTIDNDVAIGQYLLMVKTRNAQVDKLIRLAR